MSNNPLHTSQESGRHAYNVGPSQKSHQRDVTSISLDITALFALTSLCSRLSLAWSFYYRAQFWICSARAPGGRCMLLRGAPFLCNRGLAFLVVLLVCPSLVAQEPKVLAPHRPLGT